MIDSPVEIAQPFAVDYCLKSGRKKKKDVSDCCSKTGHLILEQNLLLFLRIFCAVYLMFKSLRSSRTNVQKFQLKQIKALYDYTAFVLSLITAYFNSILYRLFM